MTKYKAIFSDRFFKIYSKLDKVLRKRIESKVEELCDCPELGKPLKNVLKGRRRVHIGHFVLFYELLEDSKEIHILGFEHPIVLTGMGSAS